MRVSNPSHIRMLMTPELIKYCTDKNIAQYEIVALEMTAAGTRVISKERTWDVHEK